MKCREAARKAAYCVRMPRWRASTTGVETCLCSGPIGLWSFREQEKLWLLQWKMRKKGVERRDAEIK